MLSIKGHTLKILKQKARLDVLKYCFHRVVNDWNILQARAIESNTLNEFKGYVDKYLRKKVFGGLHEPASWWLSSSSITLFLVDLYY